MRDHPESAVRVDVTVPYRVSNAQTVSERQELAEGDTFERVSKTWGDDRSLSFTRRVEGVEPTARILVDLAEADTEKQYVAAILPDGGWVTDYLDEGETTTGDPEIDLSLRCGVPAVYLAARQYANDNQSQTTSHRFGWEKVLVGWCARGGYGFPDEGEIETHGDWCDAARHALFTYVLDQHEGAPIDADDIPDPEDQYVYQRKRDNRYVSDEDSLLTEE